MEFAAGRSEVGAICGGFPRARQPLTLAQITAPVPATRKRPQVPVPPERPQVPAPPEHHPELASISPDYLLFLLFLFLGGGWSRSLGGGPAMAY